MDKSARSNVQNIIETIRENRSLSRRAIARNTGLSAPTVTRIVNELITVGAVRANGVGGGKPGPGRPAGLISLDPSHGFIVGVDIGEHTIRVALGDITGNILATRRVPSVAREGGHLTFQNLVGGIEEALAAAESPEGSVSRRPVRGITVGVPGMVDRQAEIVLDAPNIRGWQHYPLKQLLQERYPQAAVRVENDVNIAAVGESAHGVGRHHRDFVFVSFRQGIGAGICIDGELYRGGTGMAGEIGFMAFDPGFSYAQAAGLGHLETVVGEQALLDRARESGFELAEGGSVADLSLRDLCLAAKEGNEAAGATLDGALGTYGVAVANIASLLSPELVVIGGDLTVIGDLAVERIEATVNRLTPHRPRIMASLLGEDAGLQGAFHQAQVDSCATLPLDGEIARL